MPDPDHPRTLEEFDLARPRQIRALQSRFEFLVRLEQVFVGVCVAGLLCAELALLGGFLGLRFATPQCCLGFGIFLAFLGALSLVLSAQRQVGEHLQQLTAEHEALLRQSAAPAPPQLPK